MGAHRWNLWRLGVSLLALTKLALGLFPFEHLLGQDESSSSSISPSLFFELERLARIVDISYCIGNTGVRKPFQCVSRCKEFPTLTLNTTWNTGILLSDSCGYIAVDHGTRRPDLPPGKRPSDPGERAIIVAFRGTYSITNTVIDLSTVPQKYVPYPSPDHGGGEPPEKPEHECTNCTVHMGFLQSWKSARTLILPELAALKEEYPDYPIHLVGHSLGAAVACLAALELKVSLGWENIVVTTFGEPRVGNYQLARFVDEVFGLDGDSDLEQREYRRVSHKEDPVPLLPLGEWGYRPHSGEIFISKKDLSPAAEDLRPCVGDTDQDCSAGADSGLQKLLSGLSTLSEDTLGEEGELDVEQTGFPTRFKLWQLFFAHRDYFWRLGLCVPGGDPADWGREKYGQPEPGNEEL